MSDMLNRAKKITERCEQFIQFGHLTPREQERYDFARFYLAHNKLVGAQADVLNLFADGYNPESIDFTEVDAASEELRSLINGRADDTA